MPPVKHSVDEEAAFMDDILAGLDADSFFATIPTPDPSPRKPRHRRSTSPVKPIQSLIHIAQHKTTLPPRHPRVNCTRCTVKQVTEIVDDGRFHKNLQVSLQTGAENRTVLLLDDWAETDVRVGDTLNVIGEFESHQISITTKENLVILHPDVLLTATTLSNAPQCARKPLLSLLIRSYSDITPSLIWGNMLHEVMESCMRDGRWEDSWLDERIETVVRKGLGELVRVGVGVDQALSEVKKRAKGLATFSQRYMADTPKPEAVLTNTRTAYGMAPSLLAISRLHDVEEDIWSPTYGLKGKLDATVQAHIFDPPGNSLKPSPPVPKSGPAPFEVKTGRATNVMEHRAQTLLYTLLAEERYGTPVESGLLYYTQSEEVVRVPRGRNELRGLIGVRNRLAGYMVRRSKDPNGGKTEIFLPPTIDDERICKRCYAVDACMLYRKAVESIKDTNSPIADLYELKTSHLTPAQAAFFKKWEALISLEEGDLVRFKKELWTLGAKEREEKGRCFGDMHIDTSYHPSADENETQSKIHRFTYRFTRSVPLSLVQSSSLLNGHMGVGDAVTVSIEPDLLALARGFIVELSPESIILGVDHELSIPRLRDLVRQTTQEALVFRIDRDELFGGMGRVRDNLARMFYADGDTRRLQLVVDLDPPRFDSDEDGRAAAFTATSPLTAHLNEEQRKTMAKVLGALDYALIMGMPGTGKTTVIAALIRVLVSLGKSVLLTSYTHSAVDTILLKLGDEDPSKILRIGNLDKVRPDIQKYTLSARRAPSNIEQLEYQLMTPSVVATTCLSIDHPLFSRRTFDYCIVDEASQITLPTCLGPLRFADKFVLVGDHFQLPPLVRDRVARKGGFDISLFRRFSDAHPHAVVDLTHQYRMNEDIMLLSNKLVYGDRLRCGSEQVAKQTMYLPNKYFLKRMHGPRESCDRQGCWLETILSESCSAIFVDTDALPAPDSRVGDLVQNTTEAALVHQLTETLLQSGVSQSQIGIISLYRQQIKLISHLLAARKDIEILTADRSQGRDKDCIIISLVRSNETGQIGDLVKDWRRMNVSFTRARSKLVVFGSRKTLKSAPLLTEFFELMDKKGWIITPQPGADTLHENVIPCAPVQGKRSVDDMEPAKENLEDTRPVRAKKLRAEAGLLRGRPFLQDLVNGTK